MPAWCDEVAKEIWEQKPELGVLHVQVMAIHTWQRAKKSIRGETSS